MKKLSWLIVLALLLVSVTAALAAPPVNSDSAGAPTTLLKVQPVYFENNRSCQSFSAELIEFKADVPGRFNSNPDPEFKNGTFEVEGGTITITNFDGRYFDWATTGFDIDSIFVKAGNGGNLFLYDTVGPDYAGGPATADTGLHGPVDSRGKVREVSHVSFCYDLDREFETAFAYGGGTNAFDADTTTCFLNYPGFGISRWGWTMGPSEMIDETWNVYAGAAQCDLTKGTLVGTVSVDYDGSTATVTYNLNAGVSTGDTHVWIGSTPAPTLPNGNFTVAPGQYNLTGTALEYSVDITGPIYVIVHAEVAY
jgi:hypothetical protein